jgi:hypothetical protein
MLVYHRNIRVLAVADEREAVPGQPFDEGVGVPWRHEPNPRNVPIGAVRVIGRVSPICREATGIPELHLIAPDNHADAVANDAHQESPGGVSD